MTSGDHLKNLLLLYRSIEQQYQLGQYTDQALRSILASLNKARERLFDEISYRDITMPKERVDMVLEELNNLTFAVQAQLSKDIQDAAVVAGEYSYLDYDAILSFDGKLDETIGFNHVSVSPDQLRAMVVEVPVGGKLLEQWVKDTFELRVSDEIQTAIMADTFQGLSTPKIIRHMENAFGVIRDDAETLVRTYIQSINNQSAEAVYKANSDIIKYEVWNSTLEVGLSGKSTCLRCASLDSRKYKIDEPHIRPPLHPRCFTGDSQVFAPDAVSASRMKYDGPVYDFESPLGQRFSVTPNHPFLTIHGFVRAMDLDDLTDIIYNSNLDRAITGENVYDIPATFEQIFSSFSVSGPAVSISASKGSYFHGDSEFGNGNIDIVYSDSFLSNDIKTSFFEKIGKCLFSYSDMCNVSLSTLCNCFSMFLSMGLSCQRATGGFSVSEFFDIGHIFESIGRGFGIIPDMDIVGFKPSSDSPLTCIKHISDLVSRKSFFIEFADFINVKVGSLVIDKTTASVFESCFRSIPFDDVVSFKNSSDDFSCNGKTLSDLLFHKTGFVKTNNLKFLGIRKFSGHVYDLQCFSTVYHVGGMCASNCRCFMIPETASFRELGLDIDDLKQSIRPYSERAEKRAIVEAGQFDGDFEKFLNSRDKKYQLDLLGPNRYRLLQEGKIKFSDLADKDGNMRLLKKDSDGKYVGLM